VLIFVLEGIWENAIEDLFFFFLFFSFFDCSEIYYFFEMNIRYRRTCRVIIFIFFFFILECRVR
jgi:hypothetical protein